MYIDVHFFALFLFVTNYIGIKITITEHLPLVLLQKLCFLQGSNGPFLEINLEFDLYETKFKTLRRSSTHTWSANTFGVNNFHLFYFLLVTCYLLGEKVFYFVIHSFTYKTVIFANLYLLNSNSANGRKSDNRI